MAVALGSGSCDRWGGGASREAPHLVLCASGASAGSADGVLGRVPQSVVDDEDGGLRASLESSLELCGLGRVANNAQQQYVRSRPAPSPESIKRAKELDLAGLGLHPLFSESRMGAGGGQGCGALAQPHASLLPARLALRGGGAAAAEAGGRCQAVSLPRGE